MLFFPFCFVFYHFWFVFVSLFSCVFIRLSVRPSACLSIRLPGHLSVCRPVRSLLFPSLCSQPGTTIESQLEHIKLPWSFFLSSVVTEKLWESDSTDASDDDLQITNDPPVNEKQPSPAKKPNKKTYTDAKSKSTKQASLTSFFKKS